MELLILALLSAFKIYDLPISLLFIQTMETDQLETGLFNGFHDNGNAVLANNFFAPDLSEVKLLPEVNIFQFVKRCVYKETV